MKRNILSFAFVIALLFAFGTTSIFAQQAQAKKKAPKKEQVKTKENTDNTPAVAPKVEKKTVKAKTMKKTEPAEKVTKTEKTVKTEKVATKAPKKHKAKKTAKTTEK